MTTPPIPGTAIRAALETLLGDDNHEQLPDHTVVVCNIADIRGALAAALPLLGEATTEWANVHVETGKSEPAYDERTARALHRGSDGEWSVQSRTVITGEWTPVES